ncbi:MAG: PrsW family intramembrane metalloprotease [Propionibacteriaceae bacterium]|nr:PrsW family intramembrane metalloprotease [Propionibacteriaceae bacterium]
MAVKIQHSPQVETYLRRRAGVAPLESGLSIPKKILRSKWTWITCAIVLASVASLIILGFDIVPDRTLDDGMKIPGLNFDALRTSARRALPTLIFWVVCFFLIDRFKPQRLMIWILALLWGGCIAIGLSYYLNTWVGQQMAVIDEMSGTAAIRIAVFVAPFVEEGTKACIIFFIVVIDRNRFTSRVSGAVVGGLAGAGFAFTENIIYYARAIVYGSYTSSAGDVAAALDYLVFLRGVLTAFGHPLFTLMTGVGVGFAVASRSKMVRILAPAAGFLMAAFLHMFFNFQASVIPEERLLPLILIIAWPVVIGVAIRLIMSMLRQGKIIAARLEDYAAAGWLPDNYPSAFSRLRSRAWTVVMSLWHGSVVKTWMMQVRVTELAMIADGISRGTIDEGALLREYDLINEINELDQAGGLSSGQGLRPYWPWNADLHRNDRPNAVHLPAHTTTAEPPVKYSAVDPRWQAPS